MGWFVGLEHVAGRPFRTPTNGAKRDDVRPVSVDRKPTYKADNRDRAQRHSNGFPRNSNPLPNIHPSGVPILDGNGPHAESTPSHSCFFGRLPPPSPAENREFHQGAVGYAVHAAHPSGDRRSSSVCMKEIS